MQSQAGVHTSELRVLGKPLRIGATRHARNTIGAAAHAWLRPAAAGLPNRVARVATESVARARFLKLNAVLTQFGLNHHDLDMTSFG